MSLRRHIKSLGRRLSTAQKTDLLKQRQRLESRITTFEQHMTIVLHVSDDTRWTKSAGKIRTMDDSEDEWSDSDVGSSTFPEMLITPELDMLSLPSSLAPGEIHRKSLDSISTVEAELRRAQINDSLHGLRLALGEKAMSFRADVRNASSQRTSQRAWANVHKHDTDARKHRKLYNHARAALIRLDCFPEFLATLHDISEQDMKMSGDITEENRYGQRSDTLAWFWRLDDGLSDEDH
jgi:hypothetical protein